MIVNVDNWQTGLEQAGPEYYSIGAVSSHGDPENEPLTRPRLNSDSRIGRYDYAGKMNEKQVKLFRKLVNILRRESLCEQSTLIDLLEVDSNVFNTLLVNAEYRGIYLYEEITPSVRANGTPGKKPYVYYGLFDPEQAERMVQEYEQYIQDKQSPVAA